MGKHRFICGLALSLVLVVSPAHGSPRAIVARGAYWLAAQENVAAGRTLRVYGHITNPLGADGCYLLVRDQLVAKWENVEARSLTCSREIDGPLNGSVILILASQYKGKPWISFNLGSNVRTGRRVGMAVAKISSIVSKSMHRRLEEQLSQPSVFDFIRDQMAREESRLYAKLIWNGQLVTSEPHSLYPKHHLYAFDSAYPSQGAELFSESGPTPISNWDAAGKSWSVNDANVIDGAPGAYEFDLEASIQKQYELLAWADI